MITDLRARLRHQLDRNMVAMARELQLDPTADQRVWAEHMAILAELVGSDTTDVSCSEQTSVTV